MAKTKRAEVVSITTLSKAIDKAVAIAAQRQTVVIQPATITVNWEITGRRIKPTNDFNAAMAAATETAQSVNVGGVNPQPMVTTINGDILVGFIERGLLPRLLG